MKQRGIIMRDWEVRAIREGRKTQKRFIIRPQPLPYLNGFVAKEWSKDTKPWRPIGGVHQDKWECPYGKPGDLLWVRETFTLTQYKLPVYRADARDKDGKLWPSVHSDPNGVLWTPSIHMPRWASRITLEIVSVRAQRLRDITEDDAKAEGVTIGEDRSHSFAEHGLAYTPHRDAFTALWESIHGPGSWERNDFVFAVEFKEMKP